MCNVCAQGSQEARGPSWDAACIRPPPSFPPSHLCMVPGSIFLQCGQPSPPFLTACSSAWPIGPLVTCLPLPAALSLASLISAHAWGSDHRRALLRGPERGQGSPSLPLPHKPCRLSRAAPVPPSSWDLLFSHCWQSLLSPLTIPALSLDDLSLDVLVFLSVLKAARASQEGPFSLPACPCTAECRAHSGCLREPC